MSRRHGVSVNVKPVDYGRIFPASGGLPLAKRAPQRQAYRLVELDRWRAFLGVQLNLQPKFFPAAVEEASVAVLAAAAASGSDAALKLAGAIMRACWTEERDIAAAATLAQIAAECGVSVPAAAADRAAAKAKFAETTQEAIDRQVFGAPTYVYRGELFWGQDRLEFLDRAFAAAPGTAAA